MADARELPPIEIPTVEEATVEFYRLLDEHATEVALALASPVMSEERPEDRSVYRRRR